jgi:hypothetical protein
MPAVIKAKATGARTGAHQRNMTGRSWAAMEVCCITARGRGARHACQIRHVGILQTDSRCYPTTS